ncbi:HAD superfamily phosphatase [Zychaea mexicana]|uniref:HAD superfamily phosphatase n=1 Tax=Zychaea mexicana TaxID=64656 RepID=UPI0022FE487A|nr:HAD superfamily phosphatase [Zychaea mexicana]KAI9493583.1 HAD superfamily phosphatase [Zychaea mexicana]
MQDVRNIHYEQLKNQGRIQAMAFDKDNCLTAPYVPEIYPPFKIAWTECKETFGTNNIAILEDSLGVPVLRHSEKKPLGGAALAKHFNHMPPHNIAVVGDRILTDIIFGNLNGNLTIWTSQIVTEKGDNKAALIVS